MKVRGFLRPPLAAWLLLSAALLGSLPATAAAQTFTLRASAAAINVLSISDIDFMTFGSPQWLFSLDIDAGGRNITGYLTIDIRVHLATGEVYDQPPAFSITTKSFAINGSRSLTNLQIGKGKPVGDSLTVKNQAAKKKFENVALPSSQLPAGTYTFVIALHDLGSGRELAGDQFSFVLTNPTTVELLFPADGDRNVSTLPLFQWLFDGTSSRIAVFEMLPGQTSLEEASQGVPQVSATLSTTSYQYPAAGVRSLQAGKTYVWFVEGHVRAPGGRDQLVRSPLRSFTVDQSTSAVSSLLDELERTLDPKYKPLFDQIRADGLSINGGARVNGASISVSDLQALLKYLRTAPDAVISAGIE